VAIYEIEITATKWSLIFNFVTKYAKELDISVKDVTSRVRGNFKIIRFVAEGESSSTSRFLDCVVNKAREFAATIQSFRVDLRP
jgi:Tfp pilus assembly PilM family ATPase